ncbi:hypothetical protein GCM10027589_06490 [Actinocorallia lasiicapitis]
MVTNDVEQRERRGEALRMLGEALDGEGFDVKVVAPAGRWPFLRVASRQAGCLVENVTCEPDAAGRLFFAYSWGDPIAPVDDLVVAAACLAHVLAPLDAPVAVAVRAIPDHVVEGGDVSGKRSAALKELAALLTEQGYAVRVGEFHLVAADRVGEGARLVEVWCQSRPDKAGGLYFTWAGGAVVCAADRPTDALVAVKTAFLPRLR